MDPVLQLSLLPRAVTATVSMSLCQPAQQEGLTAKGAQGFWKACG